MTTSPFRWSLALLGALAAGGPQVPRYVARPDAAFAVPDSVTDELTYVTSLAVDADGSLFVADGRLPYVLHLEPEGGLRRHIGRAGQGPGEFYSALFLGFYRDSLWVYDPGEQRISLFPRSGSGVSTLPLDALRTVLTNAARPRVRRAAPMGLLPDGQLLMFENVPAGDNPADGFRSALLVRADRGLYIVDTLAQLENRHSVTVFVYRDGEMNFNEPFTDDPLYTAAADGQRYATITRTAPTGGGEQSFRVTMVDARAGTTLTRDIPFTPRALPRRVVDSTFTEIIRRVRSTQLSSPITIDSLRHRLFQPAYYPPVDKARLARDGTLWLRVIEAGAPQDGSEWLVLSPRGFVMKRVTTPANFAVFDAVRDTVWGVQWSPEEDVPILSRRIVARE